MNASVIKHEVQRIKEKYQTEDLFEICHERKIEILYASMGIHAGSCKGFYLVNCQCKVITLNCDLPENVQRIILAHELGHDVLHSHRAGISRFHEFAIMESSSGMEYEANVFASEFLIEDGAVIQSIKAYEGDFFRVASILGVPPEMLDFKLRLLGQEGYKFQSPLTASGNFLRRDITKALP